MPCQTSGRRPIAACKQPTIVLRGKVLWYSPTIAMGHVGASLHVIPPPSEIMGSRVPQVTARWLTRVLISHTRARTGHSRPLTTSSNGPLSLDCLSPRIYSHDVDLKNRGALASTSPFPLRLPSSLKHLRSLPSSLPLYKSG